MKTTKWITLMILIIGISYSGYTQTADASSKRKNVESSASSTIEKEKLYILWTTSDKGVFKKVVFPYALNSVKQQWWKEVELIIWGPSAKAAANDLEVREKIKELKDIGVKLVACKWCTDSYSVSDKLEEQGVVVKYMGKPLTNILKEDEALITF